MRLNLEMETSDRDHSYSNDELEALALAVSHDAEIADDAVPINEFLVSREWSPSSDLLPAWYMPAPMATTHLLQGWRRRVVLLIIASFLLINAYGLCSTYGSVGFG